MQVGRIEEVSFWQPLKIVQREPQAILVKLCQLADAYLYLGDRQTVADKKGVEKLYREWWVATEKNSSSTILKVLKAVSYLFVLPALLALAAKAYYKQVAVKNFLNTNNVIALVPLLTPEFQAELDKLSPVEKRKLIKELPEWLYSHIMNPKKSEIDDLNQVEDKELSDLLSKTLHQLVWALGNKSNKWSIYLRGLTTFKGDALLSRYTEKIIEAAWDLACPEESPSYLATAGYAWCNSKYITQDSLTLLNKVLETRSEGVRQAVKERHERVQIFPTLQMSNTFGVGPPRST